MVSSVNSTTPTVTNPNATDAASAQATLSDNFSTFLTLLTSQLQNQDPLSPMDSTQFTQQLVQFSQVEQQIKTNSNLESLASQFQAASSSAALSYLGKDAVIQSDTAYQSGTGASWGYNLPNTANTIKIEVRDASNRTVATLDGETGSGDHVVTWDGKDSSGNAMPAGNYHIAITAKDTGGTAITPTVTVSAVIRGVDFTGTTPEIITDSGSIDFSKIRAIVGS
ncbi:MAG: flagellar hook capping FlgD N-terminal domain-containing protein [Terricaulis sp.]